MLLARLGGQPLATRCKDIGFSLYEGKASADPRPSWRIRPP